MVIFGLTVSTFSAYWFRPSDPYPAYVLQVDSNALYVLWFHQYTTMLSSMTMCLLVLLGGVTSLDVASNKVVIEDSWRDLSITYC